MIKSYKPEFCNLKGSSSNKFYRWNLIFWIVMGCSTATFGRRGLKTWKKWQIGPRTVGPRGPVVWGPTVCLKKWQILLLIFLLNWTILREKLKKWTTWLKIADPRYCCIVGALWGIQWGRPWPRCEVLMTENIFNLGSEGVREVIRKP